MPSEPVRRVSSAQQVFLRLRDAIVSGELPAGSRHSIYALAEEFGVSRTPIRDAVLRLADLGLVSIERNRGLRIRGISAEDIRSVFELRMMIELPAAAHAAEHVDAAMMMSLDAALRGMRSAMETDDVVAFMSHDRRLHGAILAALGNDRVVREIDSLRDATQSVGALTANRSRRLAEISDEHVPVVEAIRRGSPLEAWDAMADHLVATAAALTYQMTGSGPPAHWADALLDRLARGRGTT